MSRDTRAVSPTHAYAYLVAMSRYYEILGAKDAWSMTDDATESDDAASHNNDVRPTVSARQLKALVEQVAIPLFPILPIVPASSSMPRYLYLRVIMGESPHLWMLSSLYQVPLFVPYRVH